VDPEVDALTERLRYHQRLRDLLRLYPPKTYFSKHLFEKQLVLAHSFEAGCGSLLINKCSLS